MNRFAGWQPPEIVALYDLTRCAAIERWWWRRDGCDVLGGGATVVLFLLGRMC